MKTSNLEFVPQAQPHRTLTRRQNENTGYNRHASIHIVMYGTIIQINCPLRTLSFGFGTMKDMRIGAQGGGGGGMGGHAFRMLR